MNPIFREITKPTLVVDEEKAKANIRWMVEKAKLNRVHLRPHFKTHQSAKVGKWFKEEGISSITVSSVSMAEYFSQNGWQDILIAFPLNVREIEKVEELAQKTNLGVLIDSAESLECLINAISTPIDIWIKIDTGLQRAGIAPDEYEVVASLIQKINSTKHLTCKGLLTHAGHTYFANCPEEVVEIYQASVQKMVDLRKALERKGIQQISLSVGDTPGCTLSPTLGEIDEIRPGNFVFFDAEQWRLGVCSFEKIAAVVACPVVSFNKKRSEIVIYGGAVHLSKEFITEEDTRVFGYVALPEKNGWGKPLPNSYVSVLTQEHGVCRLDQDALSGIRIGDLLFVIPVHVCLTVHTLRYYLTLSGVRIETLQIYDANRLLSALG